MHRALWRELSPIKRFYPMSITETAMARTLIAPRGSKRYVRRKKGRFTKSQDSVGRSLAADRRRRAKKVVKKGEGDRGDHKRRKKTARKKR